MLICRYTCMYERIGRYVHIRICEYIHPVRMCVCIMYTVRSGTFVMVLILQLHIFLNRQAKIIAIFLRGHLVSICGNHWPIHQTECLLICAFCQITKLLMLTKCTTLMLKAMYKCKLVHKRMFYIRMNL